MRSMQLVIVAGDRDVAAFNELRCSSSFPGNANVLLRIIDHYKYKGDEVDRTK